jgi:adenine-specific DNA-methyltransferase
MEFYTKYLKALRYNKAPNEKVLEKIDKLYNKLQSELSEYSRREIKLSIEINKLLEIYDRYNIEPEETNIDIVIKEKGNPNKILAIFECKHPNNNTEMVSQDNFNKKAFHEIITNLFYLYKNKKPLPDYLVITNFLQWYIFKTNHIFSELIGEEIIRRTFILDAQAVLPFDNLTKKRIYENLEHYFNTDKGKEVLSRLKSKCLFIILDKNFKFEEFKKSLAIFLSPDILLKEFDPNKGNPLKKDFYNELLYIFGLQEKQINNKPVIIPNNVPGTFYSQIENYLRSQGENKDFESILELIIVWLNRILFLKLFETKLVEINDSNNYYKFLTIDKITDTAKLNYLFFQVLACPIANRIDRTFNYVPYLNSTLFEIKEIENELCQISDIMADVEIPYYQHTVLKDNRNRRLRGNIKLLEYLFKFLDYYKFSEEGEEEILISPNVLGLVFEKINGYKDGSYYTPTYITDYMSKEAICSFILSKIKSDLNLDYNNIDDLINMFPRLSNKEREKIQKIIQELTIIDPAVGSGHFLVSALNTLLWLWYRFGMIQTFGKYDLSFEGGEISYFKDNEIFHYTKNSSQEDLNFQKAIFNAKRHIIENNLFGVDINPKSVEIARLRLWIELLKHCYYITDDEMQTLPNIDINIKTGDALLGIMTDSKPLFVERDNFNFNRYKELYQKYKEESGKAERKSILKQLTEMENIIKGDAKNLIFYPLDFPHIVSEEGIGFDIVIGNPPYIQLQENGGKLANLYENIGYKTFKRTGDIYALFYEKGINLLKKDGILCFITSNKWMRAKYGEKLRKFLKNNTTVLRIIDFSGYRVFEQTVDTNIILLKNEKPTSQHIVNFVEIKNDVQNVIEYINQNWQAIPQGKFSDNAWTLADEKVLAIKGKIERIGRPLKDWDVKIYRGVLTGFNEAFIIDTETRNRILANCKDEKERKRTEKIIKPVLRGRDIDRYRYKWAGLWIILATKHTITSCILNYLKKYKEFLEKRAGNQEWYELQAPPSKEKINLLLMDKIGYSDIGLRFGLIHNGIVGLNTTYFIIPYKSIENRGRILLYLLGLLNSKLIMFYYHNTAQVLSEKTTRGFSIYIEQLPLPPITKETQLLADQIINFVNQILSAKKQNSDADTSNLEHQIDQLVYKLYDLTEEEIKIIEGGLNA